MAEQSNPAPVNKVDSRLVAANINFGFKLYRAVLKESTGQNVFVSPSSVAIALAMAYNGAAGDTKQAMARVLAIQGMKLDEVNRAFADLKSVLTKPDSNVRLQIANSLWARRGVTFKPDFIQSSTTFYGADVTDLDFSDQAAPATINAWVSRNTNGKIGKIIGQISPDTMLFLINAIHFKGKWTQEFDKAKTQEETFTLANGSQKKHPMMSQAGEYNYYKGQNFQAVSLPYGDGHVSLYIFLPDNGTRLEEFHKGLTGENWESWMQRFARTPGDVVLPRFKVEFETDLNNPLKVLGMAEAFNADRANFAGMVASGAQVFISKMKHKTFVEVNEEGTEAAAVTSAEVAATAMPRPRERFRMVVNRPFFCAIRDNQTGTMLFMGSIEEPR
jgi:serine protease inhibitor